LRLFDLVAVCCIISVYSLLRWKVKDLGI